MKAHKVVLVVVLLLICSTSVFGKDFAYTNSYRVGNALVKTGDSASVALRLLGQPQQVTEITNKYGAHIGWQRWDYTTRQHELRLDIQHGVIENIWRLNRR